ncbi:MAG TPA: DUF4395 family protein [Solirubrobacterales bacterium]|nr:DUF4395 family protein [Solirubrobacterales bacterium]
MIERFGTWSRSCLTMQGYGALNDSERRSLWLGLRFSPLLCFAGIALGAVLASPALLFVMALTALLGGFVMAKHPFDYLYEAALRPLLGGPSVPPSPPPRRFACQLATPWIAAIALAFAVGAGTFASVLAVPLLAAAATVVTTNWCLPSLIYGLLHGGRDGEPRPL